MVCNPSGAKRQTIGWMGKFFVKALDCIETPLMLAFGAAGRAAEKVRQTGPNVALGQFDYGPIHGNARASRMPSFPPCVNPAVDGIFRPEAAGPGRDFQDVLRAPADYEKLATREGTSRRWLMGEI
jgi:hypothetical protein